MKQRGFTLLETILAVSIIIVIVGTVYAFYDYSLRLVNAGREHLLESQLSSVVLQHVSNELRCVAGVGSHFGPVLRGSRNGVTFLTTAVPSRVVFLPQQITENARPVEHDLRMVEYNLALDEEENVLGLRRNELRLLLTPVIEKQSDEDLANVAETDTSEEDVDAEKPEPQPLERDDLKELGSYREQIISERIRYLEFEYFDGRSWFSSWNAAALPRAIRIIVGFAEIPEEELQDEILLPWSERESWHEDQYSVVVPLVLSEELKARNAQGEESIFE